MSSDRTDAAPARDHVKALVADGMTQAAICRAAGVPSALVSSLLHGQFNRDRTPVQQIDTESAARLLTVQCEPSTVTQKPVVCEPGDKFERVGYRVGQCGVCGQLAPIQRLTGAQGSGDVLIKHQQLKAKPAGIRLAPIPADPTLNPGCGTTRGIGQHKREKTELCGPCRWVNRGYDAGYSAGMTRAARDNRAAVPPPLLEAAVRALRAVVYRRPAPQLRELAVQVVRIADANLCVDEQAAA